jgi:hypothetical protein
MHKVQKILFISSIILYCFIFFLFTFIKLKPVSIYTITFISSSLLYLSISWQIIKYELPVKYVYILLGLSLAQRIAFIPLHPIGSDDYYRYLWDGKVQTHGINPYKYAPEDTALNSLHSITLPGLINYPDMKSIYPPLSQIIFYFAYLIGGESFTGIKVFLLLSDLLSLWGILLILKKLMLPYKNILLYALCALPVFQLFIDGHLDGLGLPLFIFTIYFYLDKRKLLSLVFLSASICIKPMGLILIPIFFFCEKGIKSKLEVIIVPALICTLAYIPYLFTGSPFQALLRFTENWTFNGIIFNILDTFYKDNQHTRLICGIIFLIMYLPVILSKQDLITKIYLSIFLLFIFSPVVHPWYLTWLAVLLPFIPRWSGLAYVSLISLTTFTILNYRLTGEWREYTPVLMLEYIPVLTLFVFELYVLWKSKNNNSRT